MASLAIGTAGQVLTVNSGATAPEWATPAGGGGGKVLQVVYASNATEKTITSTTYTDTNLTASITPTLATSKIMVLVNQLAAVSRSTNGAAGAFRLLRDSTSILEPSPNKLENALFSVPGSTSIEVGLIFSLQYLDSPSTTAATTYKVQGALQTTANSATIKGQTNNGISNIILLEIGA